MTRKYFGTDGIRDRAGEGLLSPELVHAYGRAIGDVARRRFGPARILVGRDTRASGPVLLGQLRPGLLGGGHEVVDGGVLSTPAVQALAREEGFHLALVISASHNPAADNGIKIFGHDGRKLRDDLEREIEAAVGAPSAAVPPQSGRFRSDPEAAERYLGFLAALALPGLRLDGMRVVLDAAHGAAHRIGPELFRSFGADVVARGVSPDGSNINDGAGVFAMQALAAEVLAARAAVGLALDGDADRVLLVDETGAVRDGDFMLAILGRDLHRRGLLAGDCLVTTVMANLGLKLHLESLGIACRLVPVGDRHVAQAMDDLGAVLGGEQSGHVIFREGARWFGDGLYTALRVIDVMQREQEPLSRLAAGMSKFPQVLLNVPVRAKPDLASLPELVRAQEAAETALAGRGRVLLRYSGTEPLLRIMIEGPDPQAIRGHAEALAALAARLLGA
jgi:phosphoglucosamine mutase